MKSEAKGSPGVFADAFPFDLWPCFRKTTRATFSSFLVELGKMKDYISECLCALGSLSAVLIVSYDPAHTRRLQPFDLEAH